MKIDVFCHLAPQKFMDSLLKKVKVKEIPPTLVNLELRFKYMDKFENLAQVISLPNLDFSPVDNIVDKETSVELCRIANEEMAELLVKYPNKFVGACAAIPMTDVDAAVKEIDRSIKDLGLHGIQLFTNVKGQSLDAPEFRPVFERMSFYNLPILVHPASSPSEATATPDVKPVYLALVTLGAPYYTSLTMNRLVFSGIMEDFPNLKVLVHHCGAMIPPLMGRIKFTYDSHKVVAKGMAFKQRPLRGNPVEYFRKFYSDTIVGGSTDTLRMGIKFFGADHILFATDAPFDSQAGERSTDINIRTIESAGLSEEEKRKIYEVNAIDIFRLPLTAIE